MKNRSASGLTAALLGALLAGSGLVAPAAMAQATPAPPPAAPAATVQGVWRNAGTTIRIAVQGSEARGTFLEVSDVARAIGFKPQEVSFVAAVGGNYLSGLQTTRYSATCHPNGRRVPMMGRMTPDGRVLAIHFYNIRVDPSCRDTGEYTVTETIWERLPGAR